MNVKKGISGGILKPENPLLNTAIFLMYLILRVGLLVFRDPGDPVYVVRYGGYVLFVLFGSQRTDARHLDQSARLIGTTKNHFYARIHRGDAILKYKIPLLIHSTRKRSTRTLTL